jgi:hypothetical protein
VIRDTVPPGAEGLLLTGGGVVGGGVVGGGVVGGGVVGGGVWCLLGGALLGCLLAGGEDFRAGFGFLDPVAVGGTTTGWFAPGMGTPGVGVGAAVLAGWILPRAFEDAVDPAEDEDAGWVTAGGDEPPLLIFTKTAPPPTRASTATAAVAAIRRPFRRPKLDGDPSCTGKPLAPNDFDRRMTRSR